MCDIININDKNFINDYIGFYSHWFDYTREYRMCPRSECLIHVWQNSNDLEEFWGNMVSVYDHWNNQQTYKSKEPLNSKGYRQRIKKLRKKGVKLRTYTDEDKSIDTIIAELDVIIRLNKIASISLG